MKLLKICLGLVVLLYVAVLAVFFAAQRSFLYFPSHVYVAPRAAHANEALRELRVKTEDGLELTGWYAPATSKRCTIVFFHGNGDNLYGAAHVADPYIAAGYGFLLAEYRGYSGLAGKPTEAGLYADGRAYMHVLAAEGVKSENVVLFGHSLGTGVATQLAMEFPVRGLMLLAPFLSIPKVAKPEFPYFPVEWLALDRYENFKKIGNVHAPVLIVNGDADEVIPPEQGRALFALANQPREFHAFPDRGHNDLFDDFAPLSLGWMERVCPHL